LRRTVTFSVADALQAEPTIATAQIANLAAQRVIISTSPNPDCARFSKLRASEFKANFALLSDCKLQTMQSQRQPARSEENI
jgi:hypothetical protein